MASAAPYLPAPLLRPGQAAVTCQILLTGSPGYSRYCAYATSAKNRFWHGSTRTRPPTRQTVSHHVSWHTYEIDGPHPGLQPRRTQRSAGPGTRSSPSAAPAPKRPFGGPHGRPPPDRNRRALGGSVSVRPVHNFTQRGG